MTQEIPRSTEVLIVGGGIVGCSVAYHLAALGRRDTVVLEQGKIAGGTTWHSAGQVGRLRVSRTMTEVNKYTAELFSRLEEETGQPTGWKATGSLMVASSDDRLIQLHRTVAMAELFGVQAEMVDMDFVVERFPQLRVDDLKGAAWIPGDGKVNPEWATRALAAGATRRGVQILEGVRVERLLREGDRILGVQTPQGEIRADVVILCGGMWTRQLGLTAGIDVPLHPVEHHYIVTEPLDGVHDDLPMLRDPNALIYVRPDGNTLVLGGFQEWSNPWLVDLVPDDFSFQLLEADWPKFAPALAAGKHRLPFLESVQFPRFVNGPESFTPDNNFLLGPPLGIDGCYLAAGFNSAGIACSGGAGKLLAEWIVAGEAPCDLWAVDPRRFARWHNEQLFLRERVQEVLGWHYTLAWPNREAVTGRNIHRSPLHECHEANGACFGAKMGWERPNFFAAPGTTPEIEYAWGRQNWFDLSAAEHQAARNGVAMIDQSSFGKLVLSGPGSLEALQWLCTQNVDVPIGRVVYTLMLNRRGKVESELTVVRLDQETFYLVTATAQVLRDFDWISRHLPAEARPLLTDATRSQGVLGIMGPRSRDLLSLLADVPLDNQSFPFGTAQPMTIAGVTLRALRVSYVGELGWELHIPSEQMRQVYDALWERREVVGLVNAGHYAVNSLRLEKGYCAWGADLSADETPREAGLEFALSKQKDFLGRESLEHQRGLACRKRRVTFVLEDPTAVLWGSEPIWRDGRKVGYTTSGSYGHTLGGAVGMGYVPLDNGESAERMLQSDFAIESNGSVYRARPFLRGPYDPEGVRLRS